MQRIVRIVLVLFAPLNGVAAWLCAGASIGRVVLSSILGAALAAFLVQSVGRGVVETKQKTYSFWETPLPYGGMIAGMILFYAALLAVPWVKATE
jgi:hypothetical protein